MKAALFSFGISKHTLPDQTSGRDIRPFQVAGDLWELICFLCYFSRDGVRGCVCYACQVENWLVAWMGNTSNQVVLTCLEANTNFRKRTRIQKYWSPWLGWGKLTLISLKYLLFWRKTTFWPIRPQEFSIVYFLRKVAR